jgi:redox-sensitive bicupin YhaK (pirin superfamily)
MIKLRPGSERGHARHGWLDSRHTFSFAEYHDPRHMGFRALRVINEDRVQPAQGFATHGHRDMEIVTYVLEGALQHRDSLGTGSVIRPGDVQRMSAGTGIQHSEFNASRDELVHFLQIWILPETVGIAPSYEQKHFGADGAHDRLQLVGSRDGRDGSVSIHQDVSIYVGRLDAGTKLRHALEPGRHAWLQVTRGGLRLGETPLRSGDGAALSSEPALELAADDASEVLVFDLA